MTTYGPFVFTVPGPEGSMATLNISVTVASPAIVVSRIVANPDVLNLVSGDAADVLLTAFDQVDRPVPGAVFSATSSDPDVTATLIPGGLRVQTAPKLPGAPTYTATVVVSA